MRDCSCTYNTLLGAVSTRLGGDTAGVRPRAGAVPVFSLFFLFLRSFLFIFLFSSFAWSVTPTGTVISNTATANYTRDAGGPVTVSSNIVSVTTTVRRTAATIEYLQYAPAAPGSQPVTVQPTAYSPSGNLTGPFTPGGAPVPAGSTTPIDLTQPVPLVPPTQYHTGEPIFIRLNHGDQPQHRRVRGICSVHFQSGRRQQRFPEPGERLQRHRVLRRRGGLDGHAYRCDAGRSLWYRFQQRDRTAGQRRNRHPCRRRNRRSRCGVRRRRRCDVPGQPHHRSEERRVGK